MFFLGWNFVSGLICTLKTENLKKESKNLNTFSEKKTLGFPALRIVAVFSLWCLTLIFAYFHCNFVRHFDLSFLFEVL